MLEPTVFSNEEIISQVKEKYNIYVTKIEKEPRGSANIFYIYDGNETKYVLKEFESACNEDNVIKEIKIINHLRNDGIKVPTYIETIEGKYYFKYKNRTVILMKFIDGYTKEANTGNQEQVMESAEILGKMLKSLKNFGELQADDIEKWCDKSKLISGKNKLLKLLEQVESYSENDTILQIKSDIKSRINIIEKIENIDFSEMKNMTLMNSHGDYSIMQFIYKDEQVEALLDFAKARKMSVSWEIIRSFTYIDRDSINGDLNIENLVKYTKKVMQYVKLNEYDLKWMPYFYLIQLVSSPFGYEQYLNDKNQKQLLNFAFWRCKMSKNLYNKLNEISNSLLSIVRANNKNPKYIQTKSNMI